MQVSPFLRQSSVGFLHYCPACEEAHGYRTDGKGRANWTFNGNVDRPSFTPSMLIRWGNRVPGYEKDPRFQDDRESGVCHYFLTDGQLVFCADSTHALAGKTVPLPELPDWMQGDKYGDNNP